MCCIWYIYHSVDVKLLNTCLNTNGNPETILKKWKCILSAFASKLSDIGECLRKKGLVA